eukprot:TRINITY_DN2018_c0_g7_i1.p2 TRINITY_DN2018_c0_g7~~TRINITY_DN2018_c0_g7_i1.p2  ORF type:complete len:545 (+),score=228.52 TRINITY_DN2018_c0_g7_i1:62-1636(+)
MAFEHEGVNNEETGLLDGMDHPYEKETPYVYFVLLVTSCATFCFGYSLGFTSPLFDPQPDGWAVPPSGNLSILHPSSVHDKFLDVQMQLNDDTRTWFGSVINLGAGVGAVFAGGPVDKFGKRNGIILANLLFVAGYVMILTTPKVVSHDYSSMSWEEIETADFSNSKQVAQLIMARIVLGFAIGLTCCCVGNYQTEIATLKLRGAFGTCFQIAITIGLVVVNAAGISLTWEPMCILAIAVSGAGAVLGFLLPESPAWLMSKGRDAEAELSLRKIRTEESDFPNLMSELRSHVKDDDVSGGGIRDLFIRPRGRALMIGVGLMFVQQLTGINAVMFYASKILGLVWTDSDTVMKVVTVLQAAQCVTTILSAPLMDRAGRKPLLIGASVGLCVGVVVMNSYFFHADTPKELAVVGIFIYVVSFACGMGAIPWFIMGELFHPEVKGLASSVATMTNWLLSFGITKSASKMQDGFGGGDIGQGWVFTLYGCVCFLGIFFVYFVIPETKGKSYRVLEQELMGRQTYSDIE